MIERDNICMHSNWNSILTNKCKKQMCPLSGHYFQVSANTLDYLTIFTTPHKRTSICGCIPKVPTDFRGDSLKYILRYCTIHRSLIHVSAILHFIPIKRIKLAFIYIPFIPCYIINVILQKLVSRVSYLFNVLMENVFKINYFNNNTSII